MKIAIIDSGVDKKHDALKNADIKGCSLKVINKKPLAIMLLICHNRGVEKKIFVFGHLFKIIWYY